MSAYGTVTRLAPAGRHPPKPSHQTKSFMKNLGGSVIPQTLLFSDGLMAGSSVGGSCEYHQVLETDLLLKCAPGA